jgi:hypothetical protein
MVKKSEEWMTWDKTTLEHKHDTMVTWVAFDTKWNNDISLQHRRHQKLSIVTGRVTNWRSNKLKNQGSTS